MQDFVSLGCSSRANGWFVALKNIKCFGTEDRVPKDKAIPASEYIIDFREWPGYEILKLNVLKNYDPNDNTVQNETTGKTRKAKKEE
jgi:hypothetical protein